MKQIFFFVLLIFSSAAFCQTSYVYDASGNRISRTISLSKAAPGSDEPEALLDEAFNEFTEYTDQVGDFSFSIFPNPTKGEIFIKSAMNADGQILVYNMYGRLIHEHKGSLSDNRVDLQRYKSGVYFLKILSEGKEVSWKIIKD